MLPYQHAQSLALRALAGGTRLRGMLAMLGQTEAWLSSNQSGRVMGTCMRLLRCKRSAFRRAHAQASALTSMACTCSTHELEFGQ